MKKIAQHWGVIMGSHTTELIDVIKVTNIRLALFRKLSSGDFKLEIIDRIPYNSKSFDDYLAEPEGFFTGSFLHIDNCTTAKDPEFMTDIYYSDILSLNDSNIAIAEQTSRNITTEIVEFNSKLNNLLKVETNRVH